jgi:hypothetical protein
LKREGEEGRRVEVACNSSACLLVLAHKKRPLEIIEQTVPICIDTLSYTVVVNYYTIQKRRKKKARHVITKTPTTSSLL